MSFIKIDRKIIDSEVFAHDGQFRFWMWLLLRANYKERFASIKVGAGQSTVKVKRGELIFGRNSASDELGVKAATLYIWLQKFNDLKMVELKSNKHFTIVTICKYDEYQSEEETKVTTNSQPNSSHLATVSPPNNTPKEIQESKEDNIYILPADEPPTPPKFDFKQSLINLGADEKMVADFMEARKKKKLVNTETALSLFIKEVEKVGMTVAEAVEYCAGRSWGGFRAEYINKDEAGIDYFNGQDETDMIAYISGLDEFEWNMQRSKLVFDEGVNCLFHPGKHKFISYNTLKKCERLMKHAADIFLAKSITLTPANYGKRK